MDVNLHIERLVLEGITLTPAQRRQLQSVVTTELSRLITESGLAEHLHAQDTASVLAAGPIQVSDQPDPNQLGTQIAQALYRGIDQ
ncbi:MAG TPA: hypothetical protein V6D06_03965 [Trichocoleus sp.]